MAKREKFYLVFLALLLIACAIFLHGCSSSSASKGSENDSLGSAIDRVGNEKRNIDAGFRQLKIDMDCWQKDYENLKRRELRFIKALSDQQLKLYSEYEESHKSGNAGKKELCLRNLTRALSKEQQAELVDMSESAASLDSSKTELLSENQELARRREKNYKDLNLLVHMIESRAPRRSSAGYTDSLSGLQTSMQQWQQTIQQNQQRMDMWSINTSLRDILAVCGISSTEEISHVHV